ncbi:MAG: vWA domain-containing protein [Thermoleophilia bacterium]
MTALAWAFLEAALLPALALLASRRLARAAPAAVPGARALAPAARRTELGRLGLVALIAVALALAALLVRKPASGVAQLVPASRTTIVVLDMSASISDLVYAEIARTLTLITSERRDARVGLVLFSDVGMEALPAGTPARELQPFIRFFLPLSEPSARPRPDYYRPAGPAAPAPIKYVLSPWYAGFAGGTRVSTGLATAREMIRRDGVEDVGVLLVSDLDDTADDRTALTSELVEYARSGIPLDVVAVPPGVDETRALYEASSAPAGRSSTRRRLRGVRATSGAEAPAWAIVAVCALAGLLALHELRARPLAWGGRGAT